MRSRMTTRRKRWDELRFVATASIVTYALQWVALILILAFVIWAGATGKLFFGYG